MWRFANPKEAVAWLRAHAQGPASFEMWGTIYVKRALWDGATWRWLTDAEQRKTAEAAS